MTVAPRPLFRLDAGWPFVLAGLVMLVAVVVLPGRRAVHDMRTQLDRIRTQEAVTIERLNAYAQFLDGIRSGDPQLLRRLAASQLNLVPDGETPILVAASLDQTVPAWIDQTVAPVEPLDRPYADTLLVRLAEGRWRVWLLAGSVFVIFLGLVLGPDMASRPRRRQARDELPRLPGAIASTAPIGLLAPGTGDVGEADVVAGQFEHDGGRDGLADDLVDGAFDTDVGSPGAGDTKLTALDDALDADDEPTETLDSEEFAAAVGAETPMGEVAATMVDELALDDQSATRVDGLVLDDQSATVETVAESTNLTSTGGTPQFDLPAHADDIEHPAATATEADEVAEAEATTDADEPGEADDEMVSLDELERCEEDEVVSLDELERCREDEVVSLDELAAIDDDAFDGDDRA